MKTNMLSSYCFILIFGLQTVFGIYYDTYTGEVISEETYLQHVEANTTFWCVLETDECDENEWRRIGGACNNLNDPARAASHTPFYRVLPRVLLNGTEPRLSVSGAELPNARKLRTEILATGSVPDARFTNLAMHYLVAVEDETNSFHDTFNYALNFDCCDEDRDNPICTEITIPEDDPVFRFTDQNCINMTRPLTYQSQGCLVADTENPVRINSEPPLYDLSTLYGGPQHVNMTRLGTGGLIPYEDVNGFDWPMQVAPENYLCLLNNPLLNETRCHNSVTFSLNGFAGLNLMYIWHLRNHNRIARALAEVNPCWDDEQLYFNAREINIAIYLQHTFYELFAELFGRKNLEAEGILSKSPDFRENYDSSLLPTMSEEYFYTLRWYHTMTEGNLKLYDRQGVEVGSIKITELTFRTGWFFNDDHLAQLTQGAFRQPTASGTDQIVDPEFANDVLKFVQAHADPEANGLQKGRLLGLSPYVDYVKYFTNKTIETFEDLEPFINSQMIQKLEDLYEDVRDIDLAAAMWAEKTVPGGYVPYSVYWFSVEFLRHTIASDRHWYERPNRPHAFTEAQLAEIRKSTVADFLCHVGEGVTEIQPNPFLVISETNPLTSCEEIMAASSTDFNAWKDDTCVV